MTSRFTEEGLRAFEDDNTVTVEIESGIGIYSYELNRAGTPEQLVAALRLFADEIEQAIQ